MAKTKPRQKSKSKLKLAKLNIVLLVIIVLLAAACVVLAVTWRSDTGKAKREVHVSLGPMRYKFVDNKFVKRNDAATKSLYAYLVKENNLKPNLGCDRIYSIVDRFNKAENQVLLRYGCDTPSARMFAVRHGSTWKTISPTNMFDDLGIPECSYVNEHHIVRYLAPVCFNRPTSGGKLQYQVR